MEMVLKMAGTLQEHQWGRQWKGQERSNRKCVYCLLFSGQ